MQVCRYLLEMFSVPLLRSHATVGLVDRDRLQLYHANRSVILVSSAINFSTGDGLDKFIAAIIAFRLLSFEQNGILSSLVEENVDSLTKNPAISNDGEAVQMGHQMVLPPDESGTRIKLTLGKVISREPTTVGRSTVVLEAKSDKHSEDLVVKVSWPGSGRVSEVEFIDKATEEAKGQWAIKHLPKMIYHRTVDLDMDPTFKSVADLFEGAQFAGKGEFKYERRVLRIIVQEKLKPFKSLTNARDMGQVFADIACSELTLLCP